MIDGARPSVVITGISGNLGLRLLRFVHHEFNVIGVDVAPPQTDFAFRFEKIDLGSESACNQLVRLLRDTKARAVVHLAFVIDPLRTGVIDVEKMWQINVAGTARVMEAITEINRHSGKIETFIFPSSVSAYGPNTPGPVKEEYPLGAHTLPYAIHKQEADEVVRYRAESLGPCMTYILRPHIFTGSTVQNYLVGILRGTPTGKGRLAEKLRKKGTRLPMLYPGSKYLDSRFQFLHVDDMARLLAYLLRQPASGKNGLKILNVASRGEPIRLEEAAQIANARLMRVPGQLILNLLIQLGWSLGISAVPPEAGPYMFGSYTMDTTRLKEFLGEDYTSVIQYTITQALEDCFRYEPESRSATPAAQRT
jgi:nucleoside-diphosphate-sugar epimerase